MRYIDYMSSPLILLLTDFSCRWKLTINKLQNNFVSKKDLDANNISNILQHTKDQSPPPPEYLKATPGVVFQHTKPFASKNV